VAGAEAIFVLLSDPAAMQSMLEQILPDHRSKHHNASLLTTEGDLTNRDSILEVAHEALIRTGRSCASGSMRREQACVRALG